MQFYENEEFLSAAVADYVRDGLAAGQALIVIATDAHLQAFTRRLRADGLDVDGTRRGGRLTMLDARELLASFMVGSLPDADRLRRALVPVFEASLRRCDHPTLRIYGDMVDALWQDGNAEGALRLEELWNELGRSYAFSLLCAYAMGNFHRAEDAELFERICGQHTHVTPTERYTRADEGRRLVEISVLQQRARALEAEIEHRKDLERRLRAALADAERADHAKSEFLAMMSHELRTPLNAIAGHVQLVQMGIHGPLTDAQRGALGRVEYNQRHLLALINDVLNLARIESGRVEYELAEVALHPLLGDVLTMIEPLLLARGLVHESAPQGGEPVVAYADREKTQQVLLNLLTNAIKFTPAGGRITTTVAPCPDSPLAVCVQVADTGIGIPAPQLESIFEPFVQLDRGTLRQHGGVGLGLAISRDLARGMGGDLTVESRVGEGSRFTLRLPRG